MAKSRRKATRKNIFEALEAEALAPEAAPESPSASEPPESPRSMTSADNHSQIADKPCGTANADGRTKYGGGPLDVVCSQCISAGFPHEYAHGHRANQRKWCPLLQTKTHDQAMESLLSPKLKPLADDCLPK